MFALDGRRGAAYIKYEPIFSPLNIASRGALSAGVGRRAIKSGLAVRLIVRARIIYRGLVTRPPSIRSSSTVIISTTLQFRAISARPILLIGLFHVPAGEHTRGLGYHPLDGHRFPPPPPPPRRSLRVAALRATFSNLPLAQDH